MSSPTAVVQPALPREPRRLLRELYRLMEREAGLPPSPAEFFPVAVDALVVKVLGWQLETVDLVGGQFTDEGAFVGPNHGEADYKEHRIPASRGRADTETHSPIAPKVRHAVLRRDTL